MKAVARLEKRVVKSHNAIRKAQAAIPGKVAAADRKQIQRLVANSIAATRAGRSDEAVRRIQELRAIMKDNGDGSRWDECGKSCQHHLDEGNAPFYATCYWACVIRGGPSVAVIPAGAGIKQ